MKPWVLPAVGVKFLNKPSLSGLDTLQQRLSVTKGTHKEKAKFSTYREARWTRDGGGKERWQYLTTAVLANSTLLSPPPPPLAQHSASKEMGERVATSCSPGHLDCQRAVSSHLCSSGPSELPKIKPGCWLTRAFDPHSFHYQFFLALFFCLSPNFEDNKS